MVVSTVTLSRLTVVVVVVTVGGVGTVVHAEVW